MSKSKDVDAYLQGELCAKAELATKLLTTLPGLNGRLTR